MTDAVLNGAPMAAASGQKPTLKDLVRDFLSMALLIREGRQARSVEAFLESVDGFFADLEREARNARYSAEQVRDVQYALCAFLDESVLKAGNSNIRGHVELHPLQFKYFGVHLAGEGFFEKLEALRADVRANLEVLEVYHLCLALGFEGKYSLGQQDQLRYVANTLGQEIARLRPQPRDLAPDWALPDQVSQMIRYEIPLWVYVVLIALVCGVVYLVLDWSLGIQVEALAEQIGRLFGA
ncbi:MULTISPECIES: type IVB secretion system protein IcmH/DotU [unclassified Brenneria]|uniref:type IVB secretion system protein IcmH/DotU n=1 Tax=unclassified Brenneria TaxID=2634434 RepID=UPI0018F06BA1|nr:type IVB secretion system protein IcmH/DotU [Brenneria sp. L3-3C-1]MBJ7223517.1 type IVB secretion system protein IcmH/DotU [Brenneria sp. L3-3C-1]MEE3644758.1 type IVB secretion system protein IcmH/DotU [Brenneria sp. L3_3C_1]